MDTYINDVIYSLENRDDYINRHIYSQFLTYDLDLIQTFVPIERLDDYLKTLGITTERANVTKSPIKINDEHLNAVLKIDFEIYNKILNSDLLYK